MSTPSTWTKGWAATIGGLIVGALGIAILWAAGVAFPFAIPPGIIVLLAGALFVGLAPWRWTPAVGAGLGLFVTIGFLVSPTGLSNLAGDAGTAVALGQGVQQLGVIAAFVAGLTTTRAAYRGRASHPQRSRRSPV